MPASANVTAGLVWSNDKGESASGQMAGTAKFNAQSGLTELADTAGKKLIEKGTPTDIGASGAIAWGRWISGDSKVKDSSGSGGGEGNGKLATLHYVTALSTPTGSTAGTFTSFASTSPTVVQSNGKLVATGTVNSASGTFKAALFLQTTGGVNYTLTVPVSGQTFTLTGMATQTSLSTFSGISNITSTGTGCATTCTGSLGNNVSVIGQIAGSQGTQAGVLYGFDSRLGNVSGVIVFKR
ncbi:hypothetical protein [Roseateles sp.]|uniref:hypothetical protein n=1 Tax=Roseateles sp. TaxID=1971397 RepID=UPI0032669344